jgi:hypothetical protein
VKRDLVLHIARCLCAVARQPQPASKSS